MKHPSCPHDPPSSVARPHRGIHYSLNQPNDIDDPPQTHTNRAVHGRSQRELHTVEEVKVTYYSPPTVESVSVNDEIADDRNVEATPHDEGDGSVITTTLRCGDRFQISAYPGEWIFVGVSIHDPHRLFFEPVNYDDQEYYSRTDNPYCTFLKSDFGHKFSGISQHRPIMRTGTNGDDI